MGRSGSILIPFLEEGLRRKKYGPDLIYVNESIKQFRICFPNCSKIKHHPGIINLLKDWDAIKNHTKNFVYTESNRRMKGALDQSCFLLKVKDAQNTRTYQILSSNDAKRKKLSKKLKKKSDSPDYCGPFSVESGYHSSVEIPTTVTHLAEDEREQSMEGPSLSGVSQTDVIESDSRNLDPVSDRTVKEINNLADAPLNESKFIHLVKFLKSMSLFKLGNLVKLYQKLLSKF